MMTVVDLKAAASAEVKRIAAARALVHDGDERTRAELEAGGPWVALARSTPLRRALRGRSLQLWRVALKDANGRLVDSTLIPIAFDASDTPTATDVAARVEQAAASWRDENGDRIPAACRSCRDAGDVSAGRFDLRGRLETHRDEQRRDRHLQDGCRHGRWAKRRAPRVPASQTGRRRSTSMTLTPATCSSMNALETRWPSSPAIIAGVPWRES